MIRYMYSGLLWLVQPLLKRKLLRRSVQEPGYAQHVPERFGCYTQAVPPHAGGTLWLHAVSLGETRAAAVLLTALRAQQPQLRVLLTHGTATGRAEGLQLLQPGDLQAWLPWDTPDAVQRFLQHFKPSLGVLIETEVWPNLVALCQRQGVPLALVNARLSDKSWRQAQRWAWLARPAYAGLAAVWAQTQDDARRLRDLGAPVAGVLGNVKFDAAVNTAQLQRGQAWRQRCAKPVVMLASSREGEELALLDFLKHFRPLGQVNKAQAAIYSIAKKVQWLIVPRHPQRFDAVAQLVVQQGFGLQRRSAWLVGCGAAFGLGHASQSSEGGACTNGSADVNANACASANVDADVNADVGESVDIWLGDSLGEMALYYGLADVALLGGSFEPLGGQNLIEATACGCPVVMGPHTFNFKEAAEMALAAGAAQRCNTLAQAAELACEQVSSPNTLAQAVQACAHFDQSHRGAAQRTAQALLQLWAQHPQAISPATHSPN